MIHILVVEDDAMLNQAVCMHLNDNGFFAKSCLNAQDAYDAMYNSLFDMIVSDIMMPENDGFEFVKTVRGINKTIPILFMTAKDDNLSTENKAAVERMLFISPNLRVAYLLKEKFYPFMVPKNAQQARERLRAFRTFAFVADISRTDHFHVIGSTLSFCLSLYPYY